jgi:thiol-disulfide isomerase/thioredoxin
MTTDPDPTDADRKPDRVTSSAAPSSGSTKALIGMLLAGTVGLIIFLFVHMSKDGGIRIRPGASTAHAECTKGQRDCLPDVSYTDTSGVAYARDALAGKVVLVNFWATWCHPCQAEIPALSKVYDKYKSKGVVFLGVLTDTPDSNQLLNFQSDHNMTYPIVRATRQLMASYEEPSSLPTTFVYGRGGKQVFSRIGALRERELDSLVAQLVAQP